MEYGFFDSATTAIFEGLHGCGAAIVGLLFLVIGFATVRAAHPTAGYMVGGAGILQVLTVCCGSWQRPASMGAATLELAASLGGLSSAVALLFHLASMGLTIAAAVILSLALTKQRGEPASKPSGGAA